MTLNRQSGSTRLAALVVLVALVAAGFFVTRAMGTEDAVPDLDESPVPQGTPEETPAEAPAAGGAADLARVEPEPAALVDTKNPTTGERKAIRGDPAPVDAAEESAPADILGVAGTVQVLGGDPLDSSDLNGELRATVWNGNTGRGMKLKVEAGAFRLAFRPSENGKLAAVDGKAEIDADTSGLTIEFSKPHLPALGGALLAGEDGAALPQSGEIRVPFGTQDAVVLVLRAPLTRLTVVDKQSGAPLSGVKVVGSAGWRDDGSQHPKGMRAESLTAETISPVTLSPPGSLLSSGSLNALISAEGYAWASVTLDLRSGAERTIELERGGTLSVSVDGEVPRAGRLRLYRDGAGAPASEVSVRGSAPVVYERLAPGEYSVRLELGMWFQRPKELAAAEILVEAGGEVSVPLSFEPIVAAPKAEASGVLIIPAAWDLKSYYARVKRLKISSDGSAQGQLLRSENLTPVPGSPGAFSFTLPAMEVGKYEFVLHPVEWKKVYDLPPEGRTDLRFELPEPAELTVRVLDASTGHPADVPHVSWHPQWPSESPGGGSVSESDPIEPGVFRFQVVSGPIQVSCWADGYGHASKAHTASGNSEVTLEIRRASRAVFVLRDGENSVPWPDSKRRRIESIETGERAYGSSGFRDGKPWVGFKEPGRYRLIVPEFNGFEPVDPIEFELLDGQDIEVVIDLVRR